MNKEQIAQEIHDFGLSVLVDEEVLHEMYLAIKEYKNQNDSVKHNIHSKQLM